MELDIGYNATQKAIMIWHAIMINKFLFLTKKEKKRNSHGYGGFGILGCLCRFTEQYG